MLFMPKIHTYYDNLKVSRDAPLEVIRAAYKSLAAKYHPDRNHSNDATRVMMLINEAYEVLSDVEKRKKHDIWIKEQESRNIESNDTLQPNSSNNQVVSKEGTLKFKIIAVIGHVFEYYALYAVLVVFLFLLIKHPEAFEAFIKNDDSSYVRPTLAPNGQQWPSESSYLYGYRQLNNNGLSILNIDNTKNSTDVFVKLFSLSGNEYEARALYIAAHDSFSVKNVSAGKYDIRYLDLGDGSIYRSGSFYLNETNTYNGVYFSNLTVTLYKVQNGNMQTRKISEKEF